MNKVKKTMRGWQMGVLVALLLLLTATMFMPAIQINGERAVNASEELDDAEASEKEKKSAEKMIDKSLKAYEKETGAKISSISAFDIMTKSLPKLIAGDKVPDGVIGSLTESALKTDKNYKAVANKYLILKILLWSIYIGALVLAILAVILFCVKAPGLVTSIISAVYAVFATGICGYLRFGAYRTAGSALYNGGNTWGISSDVKEGDIISFLGFFMSFSMLVAAILGVLILVIAIVAMVFPKKIGVESETGYKDVADDMPFFEPEPFAQPVEQPFPNLQPNPFAQPAPQPVPQPVIQPAPQPVMQPAKPSVGQVRCTAGVAVNQGFQLPKDRKVVIGKSMQNANLIINHPNVSNVHCSVRYNPEHNTYIVKDHSTNGTFVGGTRMAKGVALEYPAGTVLFLADGSNQITLG